MDLNSKNTKQIFIIILFAFALLMCGLYFESIVSVISFFIKLISPLLIGGAIAFVLNILMKEIEKLYDKVFKKETNITKKIKRPLSVLLTYAIIFAVIYFVMFMVIPEISRSFVSIVERLPEYMDQLSKNKDIIELASTFGININDLPTSQIDWNQVAVALTDFLSKSSTGFFNKTIDITTSVVGTITTFGFSLVFSIYMLLQKEKLDRQFTRIIFAFVPKDKVVHILNVGNLSNIIFSNFVKGQLIEAVIIGVMCFIGMIFFKMPYATMISTLVAFTALIPVVGAFLGTAIGAFLILLVNPIQAVWFVIYIIVIQQIDNNFIYPRVVGKSVGLPGLWVLAGVVLGGSAFGVVGMLVGVPVLSIMYSILKSVVDGRLRDNPSDYEAYMNDKE